MPFFIEPLQEQCFNDVLGYVCGVIILTSKVLITNRGPYWQAGSLLTSGVLIPKLYWWRVHKSLLSVRLHRSLVSTMFWMCGVLIDIIGDIIDKQGHHWQAGSFLTSRILIANRVPFWRAGSLLTSGIFIPITPVIRFSNIDLIYVCIDKESINSLP